MSANEPEQRFDLRPFLYPGFDWAYAKIDRDVERREKGESGRQKAKVEDDLD